MDAEVSTRHLSYLENGRARPSRDMVLVLASALDVPLRDRNGLLVSAGFAPLYRESPLDAPEMDSVRTALEFVLDRQEPYGAVVIDSAWNVRMVNLAATRLFTALSAEVPLELTQNLLRLTLDPRGLRRVCVNWEEVALSALERVRREAAMDGHGGPAARALAEALALPDVPLRFHGPSTSAPMPLVVPIHLKFNDIELRLFSTITTLGTPADITTQEIRIESWFPADKPTDDKLRALAGPDARVSTRSVCLPGK